MMIRVPYESKYFERLFILFCDAQGCCVYG